MSTSPFITPGALPAKGTPEHDLWVAAIEVAAAAPAKQGQTVAKAAVPWHMIHQLRATLEALGIDWRKVRETSQETDR
jgi:hypothetical protein